MLSREIDVSGEKDRKPSDSRFPLKKQENYKNVRNII